MTNVITRVKAMASINIRIDDELKARAYQELERLGVTPSELVRQAFQYVAERGQLPFRPMLVTEEDKPSSTLCANTWLHRKGSR